MILIDSRKGSGELFPLFPSGLSEISDLEYGDLMFLGRGKNDNVIGIGIERKAILDLVNSIQSGRLSGHQLPGLLQTYEVVYIIVEGLWRPNPKTGILEKYTGGGWRSVELGRRRFMAKEVVNYLNTLAIKIGDMTGGRISIWRTSGIQETVHLILSLFNWWNNKAYDEHRSHLKDYDPGDVNFIKPGIVYRIAKTLESIGPDKATSIEKVFSTPVEMVMADEKTWMKIPGIGKKLAKNIVKALQEGKEDGYKR